MYFQDESRFGLFTRNGRMLTAFGVKPICAFQQVFKTTYLYGAFSPLDGDMFCLELPTCNSALFQIYMDEMALHRPSEFKIIVLDNGAFHKAKSLQIPENIALLFLPPYSPELNPAEKMWEKYKRGFTNKLFETLQQVSDFITDAVRDTKKETIISTCNYDNVSLGINWTN
ncbi:MAG TPA: IS630 family transposase [Salinimicrobium sp.]|nr:IS630 family transposase [Salinimicrobium sp.]